MEVAEVPWIFLSHSGKQKDFTWRLYQELMHAGHRPFFDQDVDALPKGHHLPTRIVDACRRCKMGIVVLSHDYMESMWPMLELEQLACHNLPINIYPLFYCLQPADLSNEDNLRRWQSRWDKKAPEWSSRLLQSSSSRCPPFNIDMSSWPKAVQMLKLQTGEVKPSYMGDHAYIQIVVSNICKTFPPPPRYLLGNQFKGIARLQEDMAALFQQRGLQDNGAIVLGVYGMGGSGKSTLCKTMANLYNKDFLGRSCWMEFPFDQGNENQLVEAIKKVLPKLLGTSDEAVRRIDSIEEAMSHLAEGLKMYKVFLAMDNVWDRDHGIAKQIVEMKYISGSRIMVTSRSKRVLQCLLPKTVQVPSITEEEAVEVLLYYSHPCSFPHVSHEDLRSLAQSCFYEEQCHPLLLKAVGDRLKQVGGRMNTGKDWGEFISHLRGCRSGGEKLVEESVLNVLETSFLALPARLRKIFIDLVTCVPQTYNENFGTQCKWLSMLHHGYTPKSMRYELIQLEYHGLLEMGENEMRIHDLHKDVARKHLPRDAARNYLFEGDISQVEGRNWKYALETGYQTTGMEMDSRSIELVSLFSHQLEILDLNGSCNVKELSVQGMRSLRFLSCVGLERIEGWKGAPNLVSVKLKWCFCLREVGDIGCLCKLEKLVLTGPTKWEFGLPDLTGCQELKTLTFCGMYCLKSLASLGQLPKLQKLNVSDNPNLMDVGALGTLTALQKLDLHGCDKLQEIPDVHHLRNLVILNLNDCKRLKRIKGRVCALRSLEELHLFGCRKLEKIPDLKDLARLRILRFEGRCFSLEELKSAGVSVLSGLQRLDLSLDQFSVGLAGRSVTVEELLLDLRTNISPGRLKPLSVLMNMRILRLFFQSCAIVALDVGGLVNVEEFSLGGFTSLQSITGLGGLSNLQRMCVYRCAPMEELSGLGDLNKLVNLEIRRGGKLGPPIMMASLPDLRQLKSLQSLELGGFSCLETLPALPASLATLKLRDCTALTDVSTLTCLTSLQVIDLKGCSSLGQLPDLAGGWPLIVGTNTLKRERNTLEQSPSRSDKHQKPTFKLKRLGL